MADKKFLWFPNRVIFNIVAAAKKAQVDYLVSPNRRHLVGLPDFFQKSGLNVVLPKQLLAETRKQIEDDGGFLLRFCKLLEISG